MFGKIASRARQKPCSAWSCGDSVGHQDPDLFPDGIEIGGQVAGESGAGVEPLLAGLLGEPALRSVIVALHVGGYGVGLAAGGQVVPAVTLEEVRGGELVELVQRDHGGDPAVAAQDRAAEGVIFGVIAGVGLGDAAGAVLHRDLAGALLLAVVICVGVGHLQKPIGVGVAGDRVQQDEVHDARAVLVVAGDLVLRDQAQVQLGQGDGGLGGGALDLLIDPDAHRDRLVPQLHGGQVEVAGGVPPGDAGDVQLALLSGGEDADCVQIGQLGALAALQLQDAKAFSSSSRARRWNPCPFASYSRNLAIGSSKARTIHF